MAFTAKDVQALREMTGVGMMDCKKALTAADGDKDKAIEWLREKGLAAQTKKAGKVAAEGVSYAVVTEKGVGVNLEGTVQSADQMVITADGKLRLREAVSGGDAVLAG